MDCFSVSSGPFRLSPTCGAQRISALGASREQFAVCTPGGEIFLYTMENTLARPVKQLTTEFSVAMFSCLVWKNNVAAMGDATGGIFICNFKVLRCEGGGCGGKAWKGLP